MLVCLCRAVSHRKILNVIQDGAESVEEVTRCCGAGGDCGACKPMIAKMLADCGVASRDSRDAQTSRDLRPAASSTCAASASPVDAAA